MEWESGLGAQWFENQIQIMDHLRKMNINEEFGI